MATTAIINGKPVTCVNGVWIDAEGKPIMMSLGMVGQTVRCRVSGLTGIVTGVSQFMYECDKALVSPKCSDGEKNKHLDEVWIPLDMLDVMTAEVPDQDQAPDE